MTGNAFPGLDVYLRREGVRVEAALERAVDALAERCHDAGDFKAWRGRSRHILLRGCVQAHANDRVSKVDSSGANRDENLARTGLGGRVAFEAEPIVTTGLVNHHAAGEVIGSETW